MRVKTLPPDKAPFPSAMNHEVAMSMSLFLVIMIPKLPGAT